MKLITRITLPLTLTALALTGCSGQDTPPETASPTQSASASPAPSVTPSPSTSATPGKTTTAPEAAPAKPAPQHSQDGLDTASGVAWYTDQEDPALLAQYGLIADVYYPLVGDRDTMCAQSQPFVCTTPAERLVFMDASISQFQDDYAAENPGTGDDVGSAPLRENDPYASLSDEELADLPVVGMP